MNDGEIQEWGKGLLGRVGDRWQSARTDNPSVEGLESGWAVFYSPIRQHPDLMIIGTNPGGGKEHFDESEALCIPTVHEYFDESLDKAGKHKNDYRLAKASVKLFSSMGLAPLLKRSVKLNLLFFRSASINNGKDAWQRVPLKLRTDLELFCSNLVLEIIEVLKPRVILAESKDTYRKLRALLLLKPIFRETASAERPQCYLKTEFAGGLTLIGIDHLTGARVSKQDLEARIVLLAADLSKLT